MGYRLCEGLSVCLIEERCIFLDIRGDRYFGLEPERNAFFLELVRGSRAPGENHPQVKWFMTSSILIRVPSDEVPNFCHFPPRPCHSLIEETIPPSTGRYAGRAVLCLVRTMVSLRFRSLAKMIERIGDERPLVAGFQPSGKRQAELVEVAWAFHKAGRVISLVDQCLPKSIAMKRFLGSHRLSSTLVIGVALKPFTAHCWVQCDDVVMSDSLDNVRTFTPILVLP